MTAPTKHYFRGAIFPLAAIVIICVGHSTTTNLRQRHTQHVDLNSLGLFPLDAIQGTDADVPAEWRLLDGKLVELRGFMFVRQSTLRIDHFQLLPTLHVNTHRPPTPQERVFCVTRPGTNVPIEDDICSVIGTLHVKVEHGIDGNIESVYTLDVESIIANAPQNVAAAPQGSAWLEVFGAVAFGFWFVRQLIRKIISYRRKKFAIAYGVEIDVGVNRKTDTLTSRAT